MKINSTIVDNVYNKLIDDIAHLKIKSGTRIDIPKISIDFSVSQTPIREAIGRLVKDGLVIYKARRGYYIIQLTCEDLVEIYGFREMIECYALEKGIVNINKTQWEKILQKAIELQKKPLESKKPLGFYELDKELHMAIVNSSVNNKIIKSYLQLYPLVIMSQQLDPYYDRSMREHVLLIEKILAGNIKEANKKLVEHLENCKKDGINSIKKKEEFSLLE